MTPGDSKEDSSSSSSSSSSLAGKRLASFHAGERLVIEDCYREHVTRVLAAARRIVGSVDAETIAHEVFYRLLTNQKMRESFRGGNLGAWLAQVATRSAVDDLRRRRRDVSESSQPESSSSSQPSSESDEVEARLLIERFRKDVLPAEWEGVFDARFLRQLPQRDAADELHMPRTTLVYQEQKIRGLLQKFLLGDEGGRRR